MERREPRVYYYEERKDRKTIIVFDAGGDIHIYEQTETLPATELKAVLKKLGHNIPWRLLPP